MSTVQAVLRSMLGTLGSTRGRSRTHRRGRLESVRSPRQPKQFLALALAIILGMMPIGGVPLATAQVAGGNGTPGGAAGGATAPW